MRRIANQLLSAMGATSVFLGSALAQAPPQAPPPVQVQAPPQAPPVQPKAAPQAPMPALPPGQPPAPPQALMPAPPQAPRPAAPLGQIQNLFEVMRPGAPAVPPPVMLPLAARPALAPAAPAAPFQVMVMQQGIGNGQFDQMVFSQDGTAAAARKRLDLQLRTQLEELNRTCKLTDTQKQKLLLAGRGDIKRFFDLYDRAKEHTQVIQADGQQFVFVRQEVTPLQRNLQAGLFHEESLLCKALPNTLTPEQFARYDGLVRERLAARHRANVETTVKLIERGVSLRDPERRELITLLIAETKPARRTSPYGLYHILPQLDRIPEEKVTRILTPAQWTQAKQHLAQYRAMGEQLKAAGVLSDEANEDEREDIPAAGLKK